MKKTWLLSTLIFLSLSAVTAIAQTGPSSDTLASPTPTPTVKSTTADDDDLKDQEKILAELKKLRGEKAGWLIEKQGLEGQITTLTRSVSIEKERGDEWLAAFRDLKKADTNSQKMDSNSIAIQQQLESRIAEKNEKIAELTDDLRSCQNNQKWIFGSGAIAGGVVGYLLKGQTSRFLSNGLSGQAIPTFGLQPLSQPAMTMPNPLRPAKEFLRP